MGFYARAIFPRLCDWMMRDPRLAALRSAVLASTSGEVLEIGFGTGLNLPYYPAEVSRLTTADPNPGMNRLALRRIAQSSIRVEPCFLRGEELPFADNSFDCVVSTWTMCSLDNVSQALGQIQRVLRPGGRFLLLEHGLSDDPKIQRWQRRLNPIQRRLAGGCRLDIDVESAVRAEPFRPVEIERFLLDWAPRTHGTMYRGIATKPTAT